MNFPEKTKREEQIWRREHFSVEEKAQTKWSTRIDQFLELLQRGQNELLHN